MKNFRINAFFAFNSPERSGDVNSEKPKKNDQKSEKLLPGIQNLEQKNNTERLRVQQNSREALMALENVIFVEYNGEKLPLVDFNVKYPDFFEKRRQEQKEKDEQRQSNLSNKNTSSNLSEKQEE